MKPVDSFDEIFREKDKVMVVMAHPDDTELACGGTIPRLIEAGKKVRVVKMTLGSKGCKQEKIAEDELAAIRLKEDQEAMKVLGVAAEDDVYLRLPDGGVENDMDTIGLVVSQIREFKPDLIVTHNPEHAVIRFDKGVNWVNHRDHRNTAQSVLDAVFPYSRDLLFFPEHFKKKGLVSHKVAKLLLFDYYDHPDLVHLDISDYYQVRNRALAAHATQYSLEDAEKSTDFFTKLYDKERRFERFRYVAAD